MGEDFRYPAVPGKRPLGTALLHWYMDRVHLAATHDEVVCRAFFTVANLLKAPHSLFQPALLWCVLARSKTSQATPMQPQSRLAKPSLQGSLY